VIPALCSVYSTVHDRVYDYSASSEITCVP
jgi:hypothetical protein